MARPLLRFSADESSIVIGIMSGTSVDGVDAACCLLAHPAGAPVRWGVLGTATVAYPEEVAERLRAPETIALPELASLDVEVGAAFAEAARAAADNARVRLAEVALIGSHGQTVWHDPRAERGRAGATLQIGEAAEIAERTGCPVWSDFRPADVAAGGEGAPFVPFADWLLFADPARWRACVNLGGIANVTLLPAGAGPEDVIAFDTGPGNMVLDFLARRLLRLPRDEAGRMAGSGEVDRGRLEAALSDPYFALPPPKSTGRERFGDAFAERWFGPLEGLDATETASRLATAAALTVESVARAIEGASGEPAPGAEILVSGGGRHNRALMKGLAARLAPRNVAGVEQSGLASEYKEAVAFAILAYESALGRPVNLPTVTGARHPAVCGKLSFPPPPA